MLQHPKLIRITDILETRVRKEQELKFYQKELDKLEQKMFFIQKDIDVTNIIIDMIEREKIEDLKQNLLTKKTELE